MSTNNGGGGGGTKSTRRGGGVPYRLAWNDEVSKGANATGVCNTDVDSSEDNSALEGGAGRLPWDGEAPGAEMAPAVVAATAAKRHGLPNGAGTGLMVQLPRPIEGGGVSSTIPSGDLGHGNSGFGCSLLSASDSEWGQHQQHQHPVLEENRPSTSRVIANLRASVACNARPSSASAYNSSYFSAAPVSTDFAGSGAVPVADLEGMQRGVSIPGRTVLSPNVGPYDNHEHDGVRPKERPRPQSAAASSAAAGRFSVSAGGAGVGGWRQGVTATSARRAITNINLFEDDAAISGKAVAATRRQASAGKRGGTANRAGSNQQQNGLRRPISAAGTSSADRRGRTTRAPREYSFFPSSAPPATGNAAERGPLFGGGGHARPFLPGEASKGDVSEWEGPSSCSNGADDTRSMAGYALDSPGTWREAVGH